MIATNKLYLEGILKSILVLTMTTSLLYGEIEVIQVQGEFSSWTKKYFWPALSSGSINIDSDKIIIPDINSLYIQSRDNSNDNTRVLYELDNEKQFKIKRILVKDSKYYFTIFADDARFYLYKPGMQGEAALGPVSKHGNDQRMLSFSNNKFIATGAYRPAFVSFLDKYDDESYGKQSELSKKKFHELHLNNKAFSIAVYDTNFNLVDSLNTIMRTGENAVAFDGLWTKHPIDIDEGGTLYFIDNDGGYTVERIDSEGKRLTDISISNRSFIRIPDVMTLDLEIQLKNTSNAYSEAYALYLKEGKVLTSFFTASKNMGIPTPPFYYDIVTASGKHLFSGSLDYPIITEDDGDKVFLYVKREGGWFEDDKLFLVGLTVQDLLDGSAQKENVDRAIANYMDSHED